MSAAWTSTLVTGWVARHGACDQHSVRAMLPCLAAQVDTDTLAMLASMGMDKLPGLITASVSACMCVCGSSSSSSSSRH